MRWELNWASLFYSLGLLSLLVTAAGVLYALLMLMLISVENACGRYNNAVARWLNSKHATPRLRRQVNRWVPMVVMLIVGYILGEAGIFSPIRELHEVEVTEIIAPRVVSVLVAGKPQTWRICADGDDLPLKAGMVMTLVQYEQGVDCVRFTPRTNVTYLRDADHNVVDKFGNQLFGR